MTAPDPRQWSASVLPDGGYLCAGGSGQVLEVEPADGTGSPTVTVNRDIFSTVCVDRDEVPALIRELAERAGYAVTITDTVWEHVTIPETPHLPQGVPGFHPLYAAGSICACGAVLARKATAPPIPHPHASCDPEQCEKARTS